MLRAVHLNVTERVYVYMREARRVSPFVRRPPEHGVSLVPRRNDARGRPAAGVGHDLAWHGGTLVVADRLFPSTKTCSSCGAAKAELSLAARTYRCQHCGLEIDRDLNAAFNLAAYGRLDVAGSGPEALNARGGGHPRPRPKPPVKREDGTGSPVRTVTVASQDAAA